MSAGSLDAKVIKAAHLGPGRSTHVQTLQVSLRAKHRSTETHDVMRLDVQEQRRNHGDSFLPAQVALDQSDKSPATPDDPTHYLSLADKEPLELLERGRFPDDPLRRRDLPSQLGRVPDAVSYGLTIRINSLKKSSP